MSDTNLRQQTEAVEIVALNARGHLDNVRSLVELGKRPQVDLDTLVARQPALDGAVVTLKWLLQREDEFLAFIDARKVKAS